MGITGHNLTEGKENGKINNKLLGKSGGKGSSGLLELGIPEQYKCTAAHGAGLVLAREGEIRLDLSKVGVQKSCKIKVA